MEGLVPDFFDEPPYNNFRGASSERAGGTRIPRKVDLFFDKATQEVGECEAIGDPTFPRRTRNNRKFLHVSNSVNMTGYVSTSEVFYHDSVEFQYR